MSIKVMLFDTKMEFVASMDIEGALPDIIIMNDTRVAPHPRLFMRKQSHLRYSELDSSCIIYTDGQFKIC